MQTATQNTSTTTQAANNTARILKELQEVTV